MLKGLEYAGIFVAMVLLQVLLFNNIQVGGFLNIYGYLLFVLLLPMNIPGWALLLCAASIGVSVDFVCGMAGINTIATVFVAFIRPLVLRLFVGHDEIADGGVPSSGRIGMRRFVLYAGTSVLVQNTIIFMLEVLSFENFAYTAFRIAVSTIVSVAVICFCQLPLYRKHEING